MTVAVYYDPVCLEHETGRHPESARRLVAATEALQSTGVLARAQAPRFEPATRDDLALVHSAAYIELVERLVASGARRLDADTVLSPRSMEAALMAVGGALRAVGDVVAGRTEKSFALVRPPGHHACPERGMGFCLFNNAAIAVRAAQKRAGVGRVLIVDFDVHHGNGTQEVFFDDPNVLYFSIHEYPFYPGSGDFGEIGAGRGTGTTVNVPLQAGTGDAGYRRVFAEILEPLARRFGPELIVVSAGYDCHWKDPIGAMGVSIGGFAEMARRLVELSNALASGRLSFALEGGYALDALAGGVAATLQVLLGERPVDPLGQAESDEPDVAAVVERVKLIHKL